MKTVHTAFLGLGNIGGGVYRLLEMQKQAIAHRDDLEFQIDKILVRDVNRPRKVQVDAACLTTDLSDILNDPDITLVCEFMGGIEPAVSHMEACLKAGKSVVTANKQALAHGWPRLNAAAKAAGVGLYYEASVCGGIPVIETLISSLQSNSIQSLMGIINGTCNYILSRMEEGMEYEEALREAQEKGLAEPDPTADVEGQDAACKLAILTSLAFHARVGVDNVYCEGISQLTREALQFGSDMGYRMKALAIAKRNGNDIQVRVHPVFLPKAHPLSNVSGAYNAVYLNGNAVGNLMLYGQGAGDMPTATSIVSDMIKCSHRSRHAYTTFANEEMISELITFDENWECAYFVCLHVTDKPGVMYRLSGILAKYGLSIASVAQPRRAHGAEKVPVILTTYPCREQAMRQAMEEIRAMPETDGHALMVRMEE